MTFLELRVLFTILSVILVIVVMGVMFHQEDQRPKRLAKIRVRAEQPGRRSLPNPRETEEDQQSLRFYPVEMMVGFFVFVYLVLVVVNSML